MIDIDKMEAGREMDLRAAKAMEFSRLDCGTLPSYWEGGAQLILPRLSVDVAASFKVDKPEWRWTFAEHPQRLTVLLWHRDRHTVMEANSTIIIDRDPIATAHVKWDEVETKAQAYALGRCRAALKAVEGLDA